MKKEYVALGALCLFLVLTIVIATTHPTYLSPKKARDKSVLFIESASGGSRTSQEGVCTTQSCQTFAQDILRDFYHAVDLPFTQAKATRR